MTQVEHDAAAIARTRALFPHLTDPQVLGDVVRPADERAEWVTGANNYVWYHLVGAYYRPRRVLEIGTRYGYSLWAVLKGAGFVGGVGTGGQHPPPEVTCYDAEVDDDVEPLRFVEKWFGRRGVEVRAFRQDTQKLIALDVPDPVDYALVDADHSYVGCLHDCELAWAALRPGGVLAVDDTEPGGEVRRAAEAFCLGRGVPWAYLPTFRGLHLVRKPTEVGK